MNGLREAASLGCGAVMSTLDLGLNSPWTLGLLCGSKSLHLSEPHRPESHAASMDTRSTETPQWMGTALPPS